MRQMRIAECGVRNAECGIRIAECGFARELKPVRFLTTDKHRSTQMKAGRFLPAKNTKKKEEVSDFRFKGKENHPVVFNFELGMTNDNGVVNGER